MKKYTVGCNGNSITLDLDTIKKYIPLWNANKISVDNLSTGGMTLDEKTKFNGKYNKTSLKEIQESRIATNDNGEFVGALNLNSGIISSTLNPAHFLGKDLVYIDGQLLPEIYNKGLEFWQKHNSNLTDIAGKIKKIPSWVINEYLTPDEKQRVIFSIDEETINKCISTFGPEEEITRIVFPDTVDYSKTFNLTVTRIKVKDLKKYVNSARFSWTDFTKDLTPPDARKIQLYRWQFNPKSQKYEFETVVTDNTFFGTENAAYEHMLENQYFNIKDYLKDVEESSSKNKTKEGFNANVFEILKASKLDSEIKHISYQDFLEIYQNNKVTEKYTKWEVLFNSNCQNLVFNSPLGGIVIDATNEMEVINAIRFIHEEKQLFKKVESLIQELNIKLVDSTNEVGLYTKNGVHFYVIDNPGVEKIGTYYNMENLKNEILFDDFKEALVKISLMQKNKNVTVESVAAIGTVAAVGKIIKSDAKEVAKRIAVQKIVKLTSEAISKQFGKLKNNSAKSIQEFLLSENGKSVVSITAGSILPVVKSSLDEKYHSLIEEISQELRVSGETTLATELVDLVIDSIANAKFAEFLESTENQQSIRVEIGKGLSLSAPKEKFEFSELATQVKSEELISGS